MSGEATNRKAMLLGAGLGTRMQPLTKDCPKPMVPLLNRPVIDWTLKNLEKAELSKAIVNVHYKADILEDHLQNRTGIKTLISDERENLLDTGGGVKNALPLLGHDPFFVCNTDIVWIDKKGASALDRLAAHFDPTRMDCLLLLVPLNNAVGYTGTGDFHRNEKGQLQRRTRSKTAPYLFAGVEMINPKVFETIQKDIFSLNLVFDQAIQKGRLYGLIHEGLWLHVGTPDALKEAAAVLQEKGYG